MQKLIITAAICGAEATRDDNPNLPLSAAELAAESLACEQAGASIIHLHVRDRSGRPTQERQAFAEAFSAIRAAGVTAIIQPSTGGAVGMTPDERLQPLEFGPEMATLSTGSVNFGGDVFLNPPADIELFARRMKERGVKPEIEVFDTGFVTTALLLAGRGLIDPPFHFDLVMGVPGGIGGGVDNLLHLVRMLPPGSSWSVAGIGRHELPLAAVAIVMGGHVRVGLEDNLHYRRGEPATGSAQLVARVVRLANELERPVARPDEARRILGLGLAE